MMSSQAQHNMKLHVSMMTPERVVFEHDVDSISVMTVQGEITILPHHVDYVGNLLAGELRAKSGSEEFLMVASSGSIHVKGGKDVVILADTAERAEELILEKIEEARLQAQKHLEQVRQEDIFTVGQAAAQLERELARHKVAMKHKHRRGI